MVNSTYISLDVTTRVVRYGARQSATGQRLGEFCGKQPGRASVWPQQVPGEGGRPEALRALERS